MRSLPALNENRWYRLAPSWSSLYKREEISSVFFSIFNTVVGYSTYTCAHSPPLARSHSSTTYSTRQRHPNHTKKRRATILTWSLLLLSLICHASNIWRSSFAREVIVIFIVHAALFAIVLVQICLRSYNPARRYVHTLQQEPQFNFVFSSSSYLSTSYIRYPRHLTTTVHSFS